MSNTINDYIKKIPEQRLEKFLTIKDSFMKASRGISVTMKYRMQTFEKNGNWVCLANQKNSISVYFCSEDLIKPIKEKFPKLSTGKGCVRIKDNQGVPIKELVRSFKLAMSRKNNKVKMKRK